jgi:cytochrome c oxidase subunit 4
MDSNTMLWLTLWMASGAFLGGVVTPLVAAGRRMSDWLGMALGVVVGAIGNMVLLVPLWALVAAQKRSSESALQWRRDAISVEEARQIIALRNQGQARSPAWEAVRAALWPRSRTDGHSHRMTYVGVFVALAIITMIEVTLTYVNPPFSTTGPLLALSTTKVLLVALFFMHLRYDSRWYSALFAAAVPFAALIITVLALSQ